MLKGPLPAGSDIDYRHLLAMTDDKGMLQFSLGSKPDQNSGYTVDDNARALLVALNMEGPEKNRLCAIYTSFMTFCRQKTGGWNNLWMGTYFQPGFDSEDSWGRGIWASSAAALCDLENVARAGRDMVEKALPVAVDLRSPRSMAYALLGLSKLVPVRNRMQNLIFQTACQLHRSLQEIYRHNCTPGWKWFEGSLNYCNAILPQALFAFYAASGDQRALQTARESLDFLAENLFRPGYLMIIGNKGWWIKGGPCPVFDQQPVDACSLVMACGEAFKATGCCEYLEQMELARAWYRGKNVNRVSLYDPNSGGCYDALTPDGVNLNQGAEAVLSLLLTMQTIRQLKRPRDAEFEVKTGMS